MKLAQIATRLLTVSDLNNRVLTACDLETAIEYVSTKTPQGSASAVVFAPRESADPSDILGGVRHRVTSTFGAMTCVRHAGNAEIAYELLDAVRAQIFQVLLGWVPETGHRELQFNGGQLAHSDSGIVIWNDEFHTEHYIEN